MDAGTKNAVDDKVRESEHASLRSEILQNKKYIFERPLLIASAAAVAAGQLGTSQALWFVPIVLVAFLWVNLSFTQDRMQSTARIATYIGLYLESSTNQWIGWENSLRRYRAAFQTKKGIEPRPPLQLKTVMAYSSLFWLHVLPVCLGALSLHIGLFRKHGWVEITVAAATTAAVALFIYNCFRVFDPFLSIGGMEFQRSRWERSAPVALETETPTSRPVAAVDGTGRTTAAGS